jgi:hypothetical protein
LVLWTGLPKRSRNWVEEAKGDLIGRLDNQPDGWKMSLGRRLGLKLEFVVGTTFARCCGTRGQMRLGNKPEAGKASSFELGPELELVVGTTWLGAVEHEAT